MFSMSYKRIAVVMLTFFSDARASQKRQSVPYELVLLPIGK
jgi:hypothetical protein